MNKGYIVVAIVAVLVIGIVGYEIELRKTNDAPKFETYTNQELGFTFRYPANLTSTINPAPDFGMEVFDSSIVPVPTEQNTAFSVSVEPTNYKTVQDYVDFVNGASSNGTYRFATSSTETIDGVEVWPTVWVPGNPQTGDCESENSFMAIYNGQLFALPDNVSCFATSTEEILATFHFI